MQDAIEILSVELLDKNRPTVNALKKLARTLGLEFGWHYLLDISWIIHNLGTIRGKRLMDAGAGTGMLQWYLAEQGAEVLSVDRASRSDLPLRFRRHYHVKGLRNQDLIPASRLISARLRRSGGISALERDLTHMPRTASSSGRVIIYNQDLVSLIDIPDNSVDAVAAVSALEHNPPENLPLVVAELLRVLKPGGMLLATLGAARDQDWFHLPSHGWNFTESSLRKIFDLSLDASSNYSRYDELFNLLKECAELRDGLASFYSRSGDNGMPWGRWDPQYQPVGICKAKN
jgi:SAM-dependent methyltransferase